MSSGSESNSFTNLSSSFDEDIIISSFTPFWFDLLTHNMTSHDVLAAKFEDHF